MEFDVFVEYAFKYDKRNKFEKRTLINISPDVPVFYSFYDPLDVEVDYKGSALSFVSFTELNKMKQRYPYLDADCVFAVSSGDPFFTKKGVVYTCAHGEQNPDFEKQADSFEEFLDLIF